MTRISRTTDRAPAALTPRRDAASGFRLPGAGQAAAMPATLPADPPSAILTLQEVPPAGSSPLTDDQRDQQASRHGTALLDLLARLQRDLLAGGDNQETLGRLSGLLTPPTAAAPGLNAVLRAIACRAAIELTRRAGLQE
jgi:hypothetical protein